jgi:uncharacterized protein YpmB
MLKDITTSIIAVIITVALLILAIVGGSFYTGIKAVKSCQEAHEECVLMAIPKEHVKGIEKLFSAVPVNKENK